MLNDLAVGTGLKLPHYSVVGSATAFYVWVNEDGDIRYNHPTNGASCWITGTTAFRLYNQLRRLHKSDKQKFITKIKELRKEYNKCT